MDIKNICFLTAGQYPVPATEGGAVENLVEMLISQYELNQNNIAVDVISIQSENAALKSRQYSNTKFYYTKDTKWDRCVYPNIKRVIKKIFKIDPVCCSCYFNNALKLIKKKKYDIVIVENKPQFILPLRACFSGKVVLHLHNDTVSKEIPYAYKIVDKCDLIITVSDYIKKRVDEINKTSRPVVVLHNAIDCKLFTDTKYDEGIKEVLGIKDEFTILYVGRLVPDKGVDKLISAFVKLNNKRMKLVIVGGNSYSDSSTTSYIEQLKSISTSVSDRVKFVGYVDYRDISQYYHICDVAVFPSQWNEPAGLVVVEAQACGKPVIISNAGGMCEYVSQYSAITIKRGTNFVDELGKAINDIYLNPEKKFEMGLEAQKVAASFDVNGYFSRFLKCIECL